MCIERDDQQTTKAPVALNPACPDLAGIYRGGATGVECVKRDA